MSKLARACFAPKMRSRDLQAPNPEPEGMAAILGELPHGHVPLHGTGHAPWIRVYGF